MKRLPRPVLQALPAVFGLLLAFAVAGSRGLHAASGAVRWAALSDGCFVSGILETGFGALLRISQTGFICHVPLLYGNLSEYAVANRTNTLCSFA